METFGKGFCFRENKLQARTLTPAPPGTAVQGCMASPRQDGAISPAAAVRHRSHSQAWSEIKSVVLHAWETKVLDLQAKFPL